MSDIKVNIIGEFQKKGFVQAEKATVDLTKNFDRLRRSATRTFTAIIGYAALKQSVKAFAENDAAITNLTKSLDNLGFRFEAPAIVTYLENLEKTTAVVKEELFPAFRNLANATLDTAQAQELLNVALDISAGTGASLGTVTNALTRAYNGNFASLGKIQNAYTMAELKAMGFSESVRVLQDQFTGQAAAAANTYQAKITRLNIAFGDAAEAIGKGVVDALEALGGGNYDRGLELIASAGEKVGDAFRFAATGVAYFQRFWKQGLFSSKDQLAEFRRDMDAMFREDPAKSRTQLRERAKYLATEVRQTEKIRKERAAAAKLAEKEKKNQIALTKAKAMFDLEKIQIEAALKGKISEEEKIRLQLMKAIANEEADKAAVLTKELQSLQEQTNQLANSLIELSTIPSPFSTWKDEITAVTNSLNSNAKTAVNEFLATFRLGVNVISKEMEALSFASQAEADMMLGDYYAALAQLQESQAGLEVLYSQFGSNLVSGLNINQKRMIDEYIRTGQTGALVDPVHPDVDLMSVIASIQAREALYRTVRPTIEATTAQEESVAALASAAADAALLAAESLLAESITSNLNMGLTPSINVTVNNAGSVITQTDLIESITDGIYEYQKSGKNILLSSTNI